MRLPRARLKLLTEISSMLDRPNHGIAFTVDIREVEGSKRAGMQFAPRRKR